MQKMQQYNFVVFENMYLAGITAHAYKDKILLLLVVVVVVVEVVVGVVVEVELILISVVS